MAIPDSLTTCQISSITLFQNAICDIRYGNKVGASLIILIMLFIILLIFSTIVVYSYQLIPKVFFKKRVVSKVKHYSLVRSLALSLLIATILTFLIQSLVGLQLM